MELNYTTINTFYKCNYTCTPHMQISLRPLQQHQGKICLVGNSIVTPSVSCLHILCSWCVTPSARAIEVILQVYPTTASLYTTPPPLAAGQPVMSIDRNNKLAIVAYYMAYGYELTNFRESPNRIGKSNDFDKSQCASKSFKKCNTFLVVSFLRQLLLCYLVLLYVPLMAD